MGLQKAPNLAQTGRRAASCTNSKSSMSGLTVVCSERERCWLVPVLLQSRRRTRAIPKDGQLQALAHFSEVLPWPFPAKLIHVRDHRNIEPQSGEPAKQQSVVPHVD